MLESPLTLPCGATLPNRLAKAAMTEGHTNEAAVPFKSFMALDKRNRAILAARSR